MDRDSRRLSHQKGSKIITQSTPPLSSDGDDGDQVIVGSTMYTKSQGRWMPFKSGGGNVNDGWHGSQKYVKILPRDFVPDNETDSSTLPSISYSDGLDPAESYTAGGDYVASDPTASGGGLGIIRHPTGSGMGMGCFVPVPLGYWAIASKIYMSNALTGSGANGVMFYQGNLTNGSATTLVNAIKDGNARVVFDTAMLSQEHNYLHIQLNGMSADTLIYGGYVEISRVKTAQAIAEEEGSGEGDSLPRQV